MAIIAAPPPRGFFKSRQAQGRAACFLSVIFPHNQMQILPYNRVLKDLNGLTPPQLLEKLDGVFILNPNGPLHRPASTSSAFSWTANGTRYISAPGSPQPPIPSKSSM